MIPSVRALLFSGIAVGAILTGGAAVAATSVSAPSAVTAGQEQPPSAVEDFSYPDAARILANQGITLKRGDGRITLTECDNSDINQIKVMSRVGQEEFCFTASSTTGYLALELADVYAIQTKDQIVRAELSAEGKSQTVDVPKNVIQGVGEGLGKPPTVLLEIRVTG
ncbi:hypothetical protein ACFQ67_04900 [Streptomyces sp. NPDC056488]|uniref:hypothetical protein n=1 Tax=Streptomyces sp. NPDC056488 TaxID=3345836 RepID=UPI00369F4D1E